MGKALKNEMFSLDLPSEDEFEIDFQPSENKKQKEEAVFQMDNSVPEDTDDFFHEFNKPTQGTKRITKQELLHEFQKINTKMNPELHKTLKVYCSMNEITKNEAFATALTEFKEKNESKPIVFANEVNGMHFELGMANNLRNSVNFEVGKKLFKAIKQFSIMNDLKLVDLYELAIIEYLHSKRFNLKTSQEV